MDDDDRTGRMTPLADAMRGVTEVLQSMLVDGAALARPPGGDPPRALSPQPGDMRWTSSADGHLTTALPGQAAACAWCRGTGYRVVESAHYAPLTDTVECAACHPWRAAVDAINAARLPGLRALYEPATDWSRVQVEASRGCGDGGASGLRHALFNATRAIGDPVQSEPLGLLLYGPTGTGKTRIAANAARYVALRGRSVRWWDGRALLAELRGVHGAEHREMVARLVAPTLLVLDELDPATERERNDLAEVYHGRFAARRPTWITSNLAGDALDRGLTPSVLSRAHRGVVARLAGADARRGAP